MTDLILREWNQKRIRIREDRYVCLTDMAKASGRELKAWLRTDSSKSYLEALSRSVKKSTDQLVIKIKTGQNNERGTWGHPKVALRFAQWCSDEFAIQVDDWIDELLTTGSVSLANSKVYQITDILLRKPAAWELMFTSSWVAEAEKLTGWKWTYRCMGKFINNCVYDYLPAEIVEALKKLNPVNDAGSRDCKHHQFLQPEVRDRVASHLQDVETLMKVSDGDMEFFKSLMIKKYGSFKLSGQDDMPLFKAETVFLIKPSA